LDAHEINLEIRICINEMYIKVRVCKYSSYAFPIQTGLKQGDASSPLPSNFAVEYPVGKA